ncbi:MAG: LamG domain-containing protein [Verrucomicrobiia bacterium]
MTTHIQRVFRFSLLAAAMLSLAAAANAATTLIEFQFDEGSGTKVTDKINSLVGVPADPANAPTFITDSPSGQPGDTAIQFEPGQYMTVEDPETRLKLDQADPSFTLQAWVKTSGFPSGRMVFFYSSSPGGALSFSVQTSRTVFVTTLRIADVASAAEIPDDEDWHHIAVVHENGVELRFYVDGVHLDTVPYTSGVSFAPTQRFFALGAEWNGNLQYVGAVDRLKVSKGVIAPEDLDFKRVPAGAAGLTIANPTVSPFGFSIGVTEAGGRTADPNSIALSFNGATVTPTSVTKSGATTTISYTAPNPPLASGSTNTATLAIKDNTGASFSNTASFVVAKYETLPASAAMPSSAVNQAKKGFKIKTYQIDGGAQEGTIAYNESLLAGELGPNVANLDDAGGVDNTGYFAWPGVINFDTDQFAQNGYFNDPEYTASLFPGIPGNTFEGDPISNFAMEIITALEFTTPGMYTMVVNTDWTGFPNESDGYLLRAGSNPKDPNASVTLSFFDALAPAGVRGLANSSFMVYVPKAGVYPFRLLYYQSGGTANLEWFAVHDDGARVLINDTSKPRAIPAYAEWTFVAAPTLSVARTASGLSITYTGTLQSAPAVTGPWTDVQGTSPLAVTPNAAAAFYRAKQ